MTALALSGEKTKAFSIIPVSDRFTLTERDLITESWEAFDIGVLPGKSATKANLERARWIQGTKALIRRLSQVGLARRTGRPVRISRSTEKAAIALANLLVPTTVPLPRTAPDGDGGLTFAWETSDRTDLLIVDGWTLHIVEDARGGNTNFEEDITFSGKLLSAEIEGFLRNVEEHAGAATMHP